MLFVPNINMKIEENAPLSKLTTLKAGGKARFFARIKKTEDLKEAFLFIKEKKIPFFILGGGSNILIDDKGFDGAVLKMEIRGIKRSVKNQRKDSEEFEVGAGVDWDSFVKLLCNASLWGAENLSGIPGTVGASVIQNIGAYGAEVKNIISGVEVYDHKKSKLIFLKNRQCHFGYRDSIFKKEKNKHLIVTMVKFILSKKPSPNLGYKDLKEILPEKTRDILKIRKTVISVRKKKFPDLALFGTAGSFFKNIIITKKEFTKIKSKFPEIVFYSAGGDLMKLSSASILDKILLLKGFKDGNVGLFQNQPLVLVNYGRAKASEIKSFVEKIKKKVFKKTGLKLEEEVVII